MSVALPAALGYRLAAEGRYQDAMILALAYVLLGATIREEMV